MIEWILPAMNMVSGIAKMAGGSQGASAANNMGAINAAIFEKQGQLARDRARINAMRIRRAGVQLNSRIVQAFGSSGVEVNDGSALEVLGAHAAETEWQALTEEWAGEAEYSMAQYRANVARYQGSLAADSSYGKGVMGLLGGAASAAGGLMDMDWGGMFGGGGGGGVGGGIADDAGWGMVDWGAAANAFPGIGG